MGEQQFYAAAVVQCSDSNPMTKSTANSKPAAKPRGKPWPKGVSGNPKGAPKRGESWAEIIKRIGDQTGSEAAEASLLMAKDFLKLGGGVTLKEASIYAAFRAFINDPQPGLLNILIERAEGKVADIHAEVPWDVLAQQYGIDPAKVTTLAEQLFAEAVPQDE